MTIGIYCVINSTNGKRYIGQSKNVWRRLNDHISSLNRGTHRNIHLQRAWNLNGCDSFGYSILKVCDVSELDKLESYFIDYYNTMNNKFGYNLETGGNKNKELSKETRDKISKSRLGRDTMSNEAKTKMSGRLKGNQIRKGKKMPEDNKQKLIQAHIGNKYTLGYKHTEENKKKMSETRKGNKFALGHIQSDEARKKKSEAAKRFWQRAGDEVKAKMLGNLKRSAIED